jgi:hypothetical protein
MDSDIQDIEIASLGEPALRRLIAVGEPGGVELKSSIPKDGLAPSVAAFANSSGGWLLLGVRDDGSICGFVTPGTAGVQDWLRDLLQPAIDPLPEFRSSVVPTPDGPVVAVRIPTSSNTPHVLRRTGVVYERLTGGKRPIDSQARLVAMCQAPGIAEKLAVERLTVPPLVSGALAARMGGPEMNGQTRVAEWFVAASPLQVPVGFADAVLRAAAVRAVERVAAEQLRSLTESTAQLVSKVTPLPRGYVVDGSSLISGDEMALTIDAGGTTVARWSTRLFRGTHHLPGIGQDVLLPLLRLAAMVLGHADGPVALHAHLVVRPTDREYGSFITVWAADQEGRLEAPASAPCFLGGRRASAADDELRRQADAWWRELGRAAGLALWEP